MQRLKELTDKEEAKKNERERERKRLYIYIKEGRDKQSTQTAAMGPAVKGKRLQQP